MHKLFTLFLSVILFSSIAQTKPVPAKKQAAKKREMARIIVTNVLLRDTTTFKTSLQYFDSMCRVSDHNVNVYDQYMEETYFREFQHSIFSLKNNKNILVYEGLSKRLSPKEISEKLLMCDSIVEFFVDDQGNEINNRVYNCDSLSAVMGISAIRFYESWTFNESNFMIDKETLGYQIMRYDEEKKVYRQILTIIRDEESRKKIWKLCGSFLDY
jgi:hypothetical protein